jgi:hypothetical protein
MTPKEKAQELFDKFNNPDRTNYPYYSHNAQQCALIAVDEMLTWFKAHSYSNKNYDAFVFYNEVKQEIEAL